MSFYEDFDGYFDREYPFGMPGDIWQSKNGPIKVSDMSETHVKACMKIVGEDDGWYGRFLCELVKRKKEK